MRKNLSKKLAISLVLFSLAMPQVACQSDKSQKIPGNKYGQSQNAIEENDANIKALEDFVGIKDIESIKLTLDESIGGHGNKNDIVVLEKVINMDDKGQLVVLADIIMGGNKKDQKDSKDYKEARDYMETYNKLIKQPVDKASRDALVKSIKSSSLRKDQIIKDKSELKSMISFKSASGDKVDLNLEEGSGNFDNFLVNKKGDVRGITIEEMEFIDKILSANKDNGELSFDLEGYVKGKGDYIKYRISKTDVKIPDRLQEPTYGDRKNLYLAYVNDMLKNTDFKDGLDKYLGQTLSFERYRLKKESSKEDPHEENYLVGIFSGDKLVGAYKSKFEYVNSFDGKSLENLTKVKYKDWVKGKMDHDKDAAELEKLSPEDLIKKFVDFQSSRDDKQDGLKIAKYTDGTREIFIEYKNMPNLSIDDIKSAKLLSLRQHNKIKESTIYIGKVDYEYKDETVRKSGIYEEKFIVTNLGDGLGYRLDMY